LSKSKIINYGKILRQVLPVIEKAGRLAKSGQKKIRIEYKGRINPVTDADKRCEKFLVKELSKLCDAGFLCEEKTFKKTKKTMWVIDPIDGTVNYSHGGRMWSVSVSLVRDGTPVIGVTYNPANREIFYAAAGKGAFLNGKKIKVSRVKKIKRALISTGFPYYVWKKPVRTVGLFKKFLVNAQGIRRPGSATLDMAYVACGRFDGFWEEGLYPWDTGAGKILLEEAGGKVTDYSGGEIAIAAKRGNKDRTILCSNKLLHKQMLKIISGN